MFSSLATAPLDEPKSVTGLFAENLATNSTPEWWLAENYPGTNDFNNAALSDTDGDGMRAWQEYVANTQPTNANSKLAITRAQSIRGTNYLISWQSVATDRHYSVYWGTHLRNSLAPLATNLDGTPPENSYTDATHSAETNIFYRIQVRK